MEAKDTVMDTIQIHNRTAVDITETNMWERIRPILQAQAGITWDIAFKAGQDAERGKVAK